MHIGDLTLVFTEYGRFAHEAQWREIREALNDFRRRFLYDATTRFPPPHPEFYMYASDLVLLGICRIPKASSGPNYLSGKEVAQALYTINGLFFDPGEKPRELSVEIMKSHVDPTFMSISWASMHNPWPQEPFSIQAAPNLVMDVYMYGRDFYPNRSFNERVAHDMDAIHDEITRETDDSRKPVRKTIYLSHSNHPALLLHPISHIFLLPDPLIPIPFAHPPPNPHLQPSNRSKYLATPITPKSLALQRD
ncbi:MAG: hypothetical protein Q9215_007918 [Flavoplaca cf. flavocitrina]